MNLRSYYFFLFLLCFLLNVTVESRAQEISKKGLFNLGVEGGVQFTGIRDFDAVYRPSAGIGYTVGGFVEYYINGWLKIRGGVGLDNRVFQLNGGFPFIDSTGKKLESYYYYQADYSFNYLTIPVNIIYQKGNDKFKVILQGGVFFSVLMNTTIKGDEDIYIAPEDYYLVKDSTLKPGHNHTVFSGNTRGLVSYFSSVYKPENYRFSTTDYGLSLQIGFLWNITRQLGLSAGFNFSFGFMNLFEDPEVLTKWSKINKIKLGLTYTLKKKAARKKHKMQDFPG